MVQVPSFSVIVKEFFFHFMMDFRFFILSWRPWRGADRVVPRIWNFLERVGEPNCEGAEDSGGERGKEAGGEEEGEEEEERDKGPRARVRATGVALARRGESKGGKRKKKKKKEKGVDRPRGRDLGGVGRGGGCALRDGDHDGVCDGDHRWGELSSVEYR